MPVRVCVSLLVCTLSTYLCVCVCVRACVCVLLRPLFLPRAHMHVPIFQIQDKKGLRQRLQDLYNICLTVQNGLDMVAGLGERVKK